MERIDAHVREPFLSEFAAYYRTMEFEVAEDCRAIYQAECIRSRRFIERVPSSLKAAGRESRISATLPEIMADQKSCVLPMPSGVRPTDRIQFRLSLEVADEWRNASSLFLGTSALVLLRCFGGFPLELGRLVVLGGSRAGRRSSGGDIDGSLVVGRGIDQLWLHVTTVEASWLSNLRGRIVRFGTKRTGEAGWLRKVRRLRDLTLGPASNGTNGANKETNGTGASQCAILRGSFEATIFERDEVRAGLGLRFRSSSRQRIPPDWGCYRRADEPQQEAQGLSAWARCSVSLIAV